MQNYLGHQTLTRCSDYVLFSISQKQVMVMLGEEPAQDCTICRIHFVLFPV